MDEIRLTASEWVVYIALRGAVIGLVLGLVPLIAGIIKKKVRKGVIGLVVSTLGGALAGIIISLPAMAIFTWLILREQVVATNDASPQNEPVPAETKEN